MESNKKHSSSDISIDLEEVFRQGEAVRKEFEKSLEALENLVKLFKSDVDNLPLLSHILAKDVVFEGTH